jgi:hypothetical protein
MRNVFYAAAGIFLLALAFNLASSSARAQAGARIIDMTTSGNLANPLVLDDAGRIWSGLTPSSSPLVTVPGAVTIAGSDYQDNRLFIACANGDLYSFLHGQLTFVRNVISGAPTPATPQSWSQIKERYR